MYSGLFLTSRNIFSMYIPIIPKKDKIKPVEKRIRVIVLAQPGSGYLSINLFTIKKMAAKKDIKENAKPRKNATRNRTDE